MDGTHELSVRIPAGPVQLQGDLVIPDRPQGIVVFAHGSGSSRLSPRNAYVAQTLNEARLATLLFDLLTEEEDETYHNRFDIDLLAQRLELVTRWLIRRPEVSGLPLGFFGASTGAAAALQAAAALGDAVSAVVSRGGRPDLADACLARITAPTLLLVGGEDAVVIDLNRQAFDRMTGEKRMVIVEGATHLFEEPGTLEEVARAAAEWFLQHLLPSVPAHALS